MEYRVRDQRDDDYVEFWLDQDGDEIVLRAKRPGGPEWSIVSISQKDGLFLYKGIDDPIVPVNENGRIKVTDHK